MWWREPVVCMTISPYTPSAWKDIPQIAELHPNHRLLRVNNTPPRKEFIKTMKHAINQNEVIFEDAENVREDYTLRLFLVGGFHVSEKYARQIASFPQGRKWKKNPWNLQHHLDLIELRRLDLWKGFSRYLKLLSTEKILGLNYSIVYCIHICGSDVHRKTRMDK